MVDGSFPGERIISEAHDSYCTLSPSLSAYGRAVVAASESLRSSVIRGEFEDGIISRVDEVAIMVLRVERERETLKNLGEI